eukprot:scaffold8036_cov128-Isochrysis_galbana.AAC.3
MASIAQSHIQPCTAGVPALASVACRIIARSRDMMIHTSPGAFYVWHTCSSQHRADPLSAADGLTQGPANEAGARLAPRSFLPVLDLILRGDRGDEPARFQLVAVSLRAAVGG